MRKALFRKQLLQLTRSITMNPKNGKRRSKGSIIGMAFLFVFLWFSLCMAFFGITDAFSVFFDMGLSWYYFALMALTTLALGIFGTVFTVISTVFRATDNEMLLSMPIRPRDILTARLAEVWLLDILFESTVAVPALIRWFVEVDVSATGVVFSILIFLLLSLLALVLAALIGWAVAAIGNRLKSKNFVTVFLTTLFLVGYYVVYFRIQKILNKIIASAEAQAAAMSGTWNPFFALGRAAQGDVLSFLYVALLCIVPFVLLVVVLSRSFVKLATTNRGAAKRVYKETATKLESHKNALFRKELRHFLGSPAYMMNGGLGILLMPALAVVLLIKKAAFRTALQGLIAQAGDEFPIAALLPLAGTVLISFTTTMNMLTAPSISIEAHTLWISKSLPITAKEFFDAKEQLHLVLTAIPAAVLAIAIWIAVGFDTMAAGDFILMLVYVICFIEFMAAAGLALNLLMPNMTWTNETVAVKQSGSALIAIFGGWILAAGIGFLYFLLRNTVTPTTFLIAGIFVFALIARLINRWIYTKGAEIYERL